MTGNTSNRQTPDGDAGANSARDPTPSCRPQQRASISSIWTNLAPIDFSIAASPRMVESRVQVMTMEVFPGISMDPDIRFGKPCLTGTRIDVATIVGAIAAGETVETVAEEYALSVEQVRSALSYAAHVAHTCRRPFDRRREGSARRELPPRPATAPARRRIRR